MMGCIYHQGAVLAHGRRSSRRGYRRCFCYPPFLTTTTATTLFRYRAVSQRRRVAMRHVKALSVLVVLAVLASMQWSAQAAPLSQEVGPPVPGQPDGNAA